jgi:hypothetical protein
MEMKPCHLHLVQLLKPTNHNERTNFFIKMQKAKAEDGFLDRVVFNDESTFHLRGKVLWHNMRIWDTENPHAIVQHRKGFPKD